MAVAPEADRERPMQSLIGPHERHQPLRSLQIYQEIEIVFQPG